jgi:hypothetical protein
MVWATAAFLLALVVLSMIVSVVASAIYTYVFVLTAYLVNILAFFVLFWRLSATNDAKGKRSPATAAG